MLEQSHRLGVGRRPASLHEGSTLIRGMSEKSGIDREFISER